MDGKEKIKLITPLSYGLPKTGQIISYEYNDDGALQVGWWLGRINVNNRVRFIEKEIVSGEHTITDLVTRLMWPKSGLSLLCNNGGQLNWSNALSYSAAQIFSGFSDWRLPNIMEIFSIINHNAIDPATYSVFTDVQTLAYGGYWSSTTYKSSTGYAIQARFSNGIMATLAKSSINYIRPVRSV